MGVASQAMSKEPADILLASLPPQGWDDLATKTDLEADLPRHSTAWCGIMC